MIVRLPDDIINAILDFLVPCTVCREEIPTLHQIIGNLFFSV